MKKFNQLFTLVAICVCFISCDSGISFNGKVVDKNTHQPISGVRISIKDRDTTFTDSIGKHKYGKMFYGSFGDNEILLEKDGYQAKHLNISKQRQQQFNAVVELEKSKGTAVYSIDRKYLKAMFYFNKYVLSLLNVLTLIFVSLKKKIEYRSVWIIGILLLNLTLFYSFTDFSLVKYHILNGPVYLTHYLVHPYSLKIVIPVATILFWVIYLIKREWIINKIVTTESTIQINQ